MNSTGIFLFWGLNILILVLTIGLVVSFLFANRYRKDVFSRLAQSLEMLGFAKRGWARQIPTSLGRDAGGYYFAIIDGKPFEAHFYAEGGRKFKLIPYVEFVLLGYFNAWLAISTANWHMLQLGGTMPQKLTLPGYEGLEIKTADENSARVLLENEHVHRMLQQMLVAKDAALLTIYPRDIHLTIKLSSPGNVSVSTIQAWLKNMVAIAEIAAILPMLNPEVVYDHHVQAQSRLPDAGRHILLIFLVLLLMPLLILALFLMK